MLPQVTQFAGGRKWMVAVGNCSLEEKGQVEQTLKEETV